MRIDERVGAIVANAPEFGLQVVVVTMRPQEDLTRQGFQNPEGELIVLGDVRIFGVIHQLVSWIHIGTADNNDILALHLGRPGGATFGVSHRQRWSSPVRT